MNVFIKSFNRPYYLDRCIQSILLNVIDDNLSIIVLDDGTNPKYLKKIKENYPSVDIKLSPFYQEKVQKIENFILNGVALNEMEIPTQFWLSSIQENEEEYFIILEDDMWVSKKIDVCSIVKLMDLNNMCLLKLFYLGNTRLISGKITELSSQINEIKPSFLTRNEYLFEKILLKNPFKLWSILHHFKVKNLYKINYYTVYSVAGAIFSKKYYSHLWKDFSGTVNEHSQLVKALNFYNIEKNATYGVVKKDLIKTTFSSSATNMFANIDFNPFIYNNILNEEWYNEKLNSMDTFPNDISSKRIAEILQSKNEKLASVTNWNKWVDRFKNQYREVGFELDGE